MTRKGLLIAIGICVAFILCCLFWRFVSGQAEQQERYTYAKVLVQGQFRYQEIYETRERDLDDQTFHTTQRRITYIDKAETIARLTAERQALVDQASALQQRITALTLLN